MTSPSSMSTDVRSSGAPAHLEGQRKREVLPTQGNRLPGHAEGWATHLREVRHCPRLSRQKMTRPLSHLIIRGLREVITVSCSSSHAQSVTCCLSIKVWPRGRLTGRMPANAMPDTGEMDSLFPAPSEPGTRAANEDKTHSSCDPEATGEKDTTR